MSIATPIQARGPHARHYNQQGMRPLAQLDEAPRADEVEATSMTPAHYCYCPICEARASEIWTYIYRPEAYTRGVYIEWPGPETLGVRVMPCGHWVSTIVVTGDPYR